MKYLSALSFVLAMGTASASLLALPPSYGFQEHRFPSLADSGACGRPSNASARLGSVRFAQTHLMEPSWPLFQLVGGRPSLIAVALQGSGNAPDVVVTAKVNGSQVGRACLAGPLAIPTGQATEPSMDRLYTMTLPAAWVQPGLSVNVTVGSQAIAYSAADLAVSSPTELNLLMIPMDLLHYNDGLPDPQIRPDFLEDFAAAMPASVTRLGKLPARLVFDRMVFAGDQDEPILACRDDVVDRTGCGDYSGVGGMDRLATILRFTSAMSRATGSYSFGYTYGNSLQLGAGGWGGGKNFAGADYTGIFLHEMGHALGLPHWGEGSYQNTAPVDGEFRYPYGGVTNDGGGRGESWNYDPNSREFISPLCVDPTEGVRGEERSDAMQRNHPCQEARVDGTGPWDGFGDFSALSIHEFLHGNSGSHSGTVPYRGNNAPYFMPSRNGFASLELNGQGKRVFVRGSTQPPEQDDSEKYDFLHPVEWNTPVYTIYGIYHPQYSKANLIYQPLSYVGTLPKLIDPTDPAQFANLKAADAGTYDWYFWWPKDLTFRFTYSDGSTRVALYPYDAVSRDWTPDHHPWRWDLLYWAINIPADKPLSKVELFHRPFLVRYSGYTDEGNINNPSFGITADNFLEDATLVMQRNFANVDPPVKIKETKAIALNLPVQVVVRALDGRLITDFQLQPGENLDRRLQSAVGRKGAWLVEQRQGVVRKVQLTPTF